MTVNEIALEVALFEDAVVEPAAHVGLDEQMTPLLVLLLVDVPGIDTDDSAERPKGIDFQIYTKVGREGGIVKQEAPIHISNLNVVDPKSGKATRIGRKLNAEGKLVRYAKKSGEEIK